MNANRLIEEWRRQGRVLDVDGANTVLWRKGQGESVICVHGVPTSGFLYRKLLPELAHIDECIENRERFNSIGNAPNDIKPDRPPYVVHH